eukprot:739518_1
MSQLESYVFSIIMYIITILALIGAIHLIYNICFCHRKCKKCTRQRNEYDYDDYDMESETLTSKVCKIVVVSTVIFFLIFLFVGCYQITQLNMTIRSILSSHYP